MNKKILMLLFLLFVLISISTSAVIAADLDDNNNDTIASSDNTEAIAITNDIDTINKLNEDDAQPVGASNDKKISKTKENDLLSEDNDENGNVLKANEGNVWYVNATAAPDGDGKSEATAFQTLKNALDSAIDEDTIMIASGTYTGTNNTNLTISKKLSFEKYGDGEAVFDAQSKSGIFTVTATSININGLTFKNGNAKNGGAIYTSNAISNSNINAVFINNTATQYGGANYFISVSNSTISGTYTNNSAKRGGGNYFLKVLNTNINGTYINNSAYNDTSTQYGGGANYFDAVSNSTITGTYINNTARHAGGANHFHNAVSNSTISGTYTNNFATVYFGGANYFTSVSNSTISGTYTNNSAEYGGANHFNNAVSNSNISGTYTNNSATTYGGANYFMSAVSNSNISGTYTNNSAKTYGGANYFTSVSNSTISGTYTNNSAKSYGGANFFWRAVSNSNISGTYTNNTAGSGGANYLSSVSISTISGTYTNNNATLDGGANKFGSVLNSTVIGIYINNTGGANRFSSVSNSNITGTYIDNIVNDSNGGANYFFTVSNSTITGTYTNNTARRGGANYFTSVSNSNISGTYTNNNATDYGGANYFWDDVSNSNISGTYTNNTAKSGGANGFGNPFSNSTISGTYTNNTAKSFGGANYFTSVSNSTISGTYTNNTANICGGANYFSDGVSNSTITGTYTNNTATWSGGANYLSLRLLVSNSNITGIYINNNARSGGANYFIRVSNSTISGTYTNNTATEEGGGNYFSSVSNSTITGTYTNNTATQDGGANYFTSVSNSTITGTYTNNTATQDGGANYFTSISNSNITGTYTNNKAINRGVNCFGVVSNSNITGTYTNNTAGYGGANHFYNAVSNSTISGTYTNNTATQNGGANYFNKAISNSNITGTYTNNNATQDGGANYFRDDVSNSNITGTYTNNTATQNGGANYFTYVSNSNITGTYTNNTANSSGGANYFSEGVSNSTITGTYTNNTATQNGGANHFNNAISNSNITGIHTNNTAEYGGANYFNNDISNSNITGTYTNNNATQDGGANYFRDDVSNSNITGTYTNNTAKSGGANYFTYVSNSNITGIHTNNTATMYGGANYFNKAISNSTISGTYTNNTAEYGGVNIFKGAVSNSTISGTYINNTVSKNSIIIFSDSATSVNANVSDAIFLNNKYDENYGVIYAGKTGVVANNNWFGNNATDYMNRPDVSNKVEMTNWLFLNATAVPNEIEVDESSTITFILQSYDVNSQVSVYDASKMNVMLNLTQTLGELNQTTALLGEKISYTAKNVGDAAVTGKFETASYSLNLINTKATTNITLENETMDLKVNDEVLSGATLTPADAGNLTYTSSNESVVKVENGTIIAVGKGTAIITVSFAGDDRYAAAENKTISVAVSLKDARVSINNSTLDLLVGDTFTIIARTAPEGLNVTYIPDNSGIVSVDENGIVTALKNGTASITVKVGDGKVYAENSTTVTVTVSKVPTNISIVTDVLNLNVHQNVTAGATLTPADAGNLTYTSSNTTVAVVENGIIKGLKEGTTIITVSFAGDDEYATAENKTITVTVSLNDASVSVNNSTLDLFVGDTFTIIATTAPKGLNVTFIPDNTGVVSVDENGIVTALKNGTASITVKVGGDGVYAENSTTVTVTVSKVTPEITVSDIEGAVGETVNATVTIAGGDATGMIIFNENSYAVSGGQAIIPVTLLSVNMTNITVNYTGDNKYLAGNVTKEVLVYKRNATVDVVVPSEIPAGTNATVEVFLPADAEGNVTLIVDGIDIEEVPVVDGHANFTLPQLNAGSHIIEVAYSGDDKYNTYSKSTTIKAISIGTIIRITEVTGNCNISGVLKDIDGNGIANAELSVLIKGNVTKVTTDNKGAFTIQAKNDIVTFVYAGSDIFSPSNTTITLKDLAPARIASVISAEDYTTYAIDYNAGERGGYFKVQLVDENLNPLANKTVKIGFNGKVYTTITNETGWAQLQINLAGAGTYTFAVAFLGDDDYNASFVVQKIVVNKKKTSIDAPAKSYKASAKTKSYTVTLKTDKGSSIDGKTYLASGKKITMTLNGKTYTAKTNSKGQATFKLSITKKGTFSATVKFDGDKTYAASSKSAKITIK